MRRENTIRISDEGHELMVQIAEERYDGEVPYGYILEEALKEYQNTDVNEDGVNF